MGRSEDTSKISEEIARGKDDHHFPVKYAVMEFLNLEPWELQHQ